MTDRGIDWSGGLSNYDAETGIRYGVISQNSVTPEALDNLEPDYGPATCPKCGNEAVDIVEYGKDNSEVDIDDDNWEHAKHECEDYVCPDCQYVFGSESAYPDEPHGFTYEQNGYVLTDCLDSDIFVLKSLYYTFAQFCSPCVPGAGNLDSPTPEGVQTYALGHSWFEDGIAPYPVYRVSDNRQIVAEKVILPCPNCAGTGKDTVDRLASARAQNSWEVIRDIEAGIIHVAQWDKQANTFVCHRCYGHGTREEVQEREV